jgi:hypothetical protein
VALDGTTVTFLMVGGAMTTTEIEKADPSSPDCTRLGVGWWYGHSPSHPHSHSHLVPPPNTSSSRSTTRTHSEFISKQCTVSLIQRACTPLYGHSTCTALGCCSKFPYCGFAEPTWPPFPPAAPPSPAPPPPHSMPDCAVNGTACPPPTWVPNWNLTQSTTIQPSGDTFFDPEHPWGLISLDWSVARGIWFAKGRNKTNCEAVSTEGCRRLKTSGKAARCFIYHNMELALEWEETQRAVMYKADTADYFIQYTDGKGNKNGTIYNGSSTPHSPQPRARKVYASYRSSRSVQDGACPSSHAH